MKNIRKQLRNFNFILQIFGIDLRKFYNSFRGIPCYFRDFKTLNLQRSNSIKKIPFGRPYPCLDERFTQSGSAKGHYFHQDLLVARRVYVNNPSIHADIGSRIDGFVAHVASYRSIPYLILDH